MKALAKINSQGNKNSYGSCIINEPGDNGNCQEKNENGEPFLLTTLIYQVVCKYFQESRFHQGAAHDKNGPDCYHCWITESADCLLPGDDIQHQQYTDSAHGSDLHRKYFHDKKNHHYQKYQDKY